jgi:hypothetical protein
MIISASPRRCAVLIFFKGRPASAASMSSQARSSPTAAKALRPPSRTLRLALSAAPV